MNKLIRDIQIDLIMDNPNPIIDQFNGIWFGLTIMKADVFDICGNEYLYYDKDNEAIFYQNDKNNIFWCDFHKYWNVFKTKFKLGNNDLAKITKVMIKHHTVKILSREIATPEPSYLNMNSSINDALEKI